MYVISANENIRSPWSSFWWRKEEHETLNPNKSFKRWVWIRVSETSRGHELKSRLAVSRPQHHVWTVCNVCEELGEDICTSKENWDEDQWASFHLVADAQKMCTWRMEDFWPWRQEWGDRENVKRDSLRQFVQPENGWLSEPWKTYFVQLWSFPQFRKQPKMKCSVWRRILR